ncbi:hypothetical protein BH09ACT12_BH09ACT12_09170 [soil metagenome]
MDVRVRTSMTAPLVAALGWALVAALTLPGAATASAPASSAAVVGASASPSERQGQVPAASQAATRLRVVDHNIEKRTSALDRAVAAARKTAAEVILLQEVCWWQAEDLIRRHPAWTISYKAERDNDRCQRRGYRGDTFVAGRRKVGNIAIWTGGPRGVTSGHTFRHQRTKDDRTGLACVAWVQGARHRACSVHLISPTDAEETRVRTGQARDIRAITNPWLDHDDLVVLGGDFNAQPRRRTMEYVYELGGAGRFRESSTHRLGGRDCRCVQITGDGGRPKVDYIFFSANRTEQRAYRALRIVKTSSDHHLLLGWADVDGSAR